MSNPYCVTYRDLLMVGIVIPALLMSTVIVILAMYGFTELVTLCFNGKKF